MPRAITDYVVNVFENERFGSLTWEIEPSRGAALAGIEKCRHEGGQWRYRHSIHVMHSQGHWKTRCYNFELDDDEADLRSVALRLADADLMQAALVAIAAGVAGPKRARLTLVEIRTIARSALIEAGLDWPHWLDRSGKTPEGGLTWPPVKKGKNNG